MPVKATFRKYLGARVEAKSKFTLPMQTKLEVKGWKDTTPIQRIINEYNNYKLRKLEQRTRYDYFEADFSSFTNSSSFVGNVRYDNETSQMRIVLGGKTYDFCSVPRRLFDAFSGASSPGAFFARNIRGQYRCG